MKVYEVKVERVSMDWGRFLGWDRVALTLNPVKAEELRVAEAERIAKGDAWWCGVGTDANGKPNVVVEELGELVD